VSLKIEKDRGGRMEDFNTGTFHASGTLEHTLIIYFKNWDFVFLYCSIFCRQTW